jgi:hypothetical protein
VLAVGRLRRKKNLLALLEAWALAAPAGGCWCSPARTASRTAPARPAPRAPDLAGRVRFTGHVTRRRAGRALIAPPSWWPARRSSRASACRCWRPWPAARRCWPRRDAAAAEALGPALVRDGAEPAALADAARQLLADPARWPAGAPRPTARGALLSPTRRPRATLGLCLRVAAGEPP